MEPEDEPARARSATYISQAHTRWAFYPTKRTGITVYVLDRLALISSLSTTIRWPGTSRWRIPSHMFLYIDNNSILVTVSCPGTRSFDQCVGNDSTSTKAVGRKEFLNEPHGPLVPSLQATLYDARSEDWVCACRRLDPKSVRPKSLGTS